MRNLTVILALLMPAATASAQRADGQLKLEIVDKATGRPIAVRMRLKNARGRPVALRLPGTAEFGGHFYIDNQVTLPLATGQYTFEIDGSPDYKPYVGPRNYFEIERNANDTKRVEMERFVNLNEEGWWAGDLDVARRTDDLPLVMRAEGLSEAPNRGPTTRTATRRGIRGESGGTFAAKLQDGPGGEMILLEPASGAATKTFRVARTPYAWNLPVWLASGDLEAIQIIHHHSLGEGAVDNEDDGRPRDRKLFPGRSGNGRWSETVYHHVLNCGLQIPPAAGSGSGANDNPAGLNRVYAYCGDDYSQKRWWEALEAGRVFVTNGPLLRPMVRNQPPGYVFRLGEGESLTLEIGVTLSMSTRTPVDYLEIVKNGQTEANVRLADFKEKRGRLPPVTFDDSGWFLVRAVTTNETKYELASTGPYYVEKLGRPRISRKSVQFFLDWIAAASERIRGLAGVSEEDRARLLAEQALARDFFAGLVAKANAE